MLKVCLTVKTFLVYSAAQPQVAPTTMRGEADVSFLRTRYLAILSQRIHYTLAVLDASLPDTFVQVLRYPEFCLRARPGAMAELYR